MKKRILALLLTMTFLFSAINSTVVFAKTPFAKANEKNIASSELEGYSFNPSINYNSSGDNYKERVCDGEYLYDTLYYRYITEYPDNNIGEYYFYYGSVWSSGFQARVRYSPYIIYKLPLEKTADKAFFQLSMTSNYKVYLTDEYRRGTNFNETSEDYDPGDITYIIEYEEEKITFNYNDEKWSELKAESSKQNGEYSQPVFEIDEKYIENGEVYLILINTDIYYEDDERQFVGFRNGRVFYAQNDIDVDAMWSDYTTGVIQPNDFEAYNYEFKEHRFFVEHEYSYSYTTADFFQGNNEVYSHIVTTGHGQMRYEIPLNTYAENNEQVLKIYAGGENLGLYIADNRELEQNALSKYFTYDDLAPIAGNNDFYGVIEIDLSPYITAGVKSIFFSVCNKTYWKDVDTIEDDEDINNYSGGGALWGFETLSESKESDAKRREAYNVIAQLSTLNGSTSITYDTNIATVSQETYEFIKANTETARENYDKLDTEQLKHIPESAVLLLEYVEWEIRRRENRENREPVPNGQDDKPYTFSPAQGSMNVLDPYLVDAFDHQIIPYNEQGADSTINNAWLGTNRRFGSVLIYKLPIYQQAENAYLHLSLHNDYSVYLENIYDMGPDGEYSREHFNRNMFSMKTPTAKFEGSSQPVLNISDYIQDGWVYVVMLSPYPYGNGMSFTNGRVFYDENDVDVNVMWSDIHSNNGAERNDFMAYLYNLEPWEDNTPQFGDNPTGGARLETHLFVDGPQFMQYEVPLNTTNSGQKLRLYVGGQRLGVYVSDYREFSYWEGENAPIRRFTAANVTPIPGHSTHYGVIEIDLAPYIEAGKKSIFFGICNNTYWTYQDFGNGGFVTRTNSGNMSGFGGTLWGFETISKDRTTESEYTDRKTAYAVLSKISFINGSNGTMNIMTATSSTVETIKIETAAAKAAYEGLTENQKRYIPSDAVAKITRAETDIAAREQIDYENSLREGFTINGTILTKYTGNGGEVNIHPSLGITDIASDSFAGSNITSITIPETVRYISENAFADCTELTTVTIAEGISSISRQAFSGCVKLTQINFPESLESIGDRAFDGCGALTTVTIPAGVKNIGNNPFANCTRLTAINVSAQNAAYASSSGVLFDKQSRTLIQYPGGRVGASYSVPTTVLNINASFAGCNNLTAITIPRSVTTIASGAFFGAARLANINVNTNNSNFTSTNGVLFNKSRSNLISYPAGKTARTYAIPSPVRTIAAFAFAGNRNITNIDIPRAITEIGANAFDSCVNLNNVAILGVNTNIRENAFLGCNSALIIRANRNALAITYAVQNNIATQLLTVHTVTFISNGRIHNMQDNVEYGSAARTPANPKRTGHKFAGWDRSFSSVKSNLTVTAKWTRNRYRVVFRNRGKTINTQNVQYGKAAKAPKRPKRTGFTFVRWDKKFNNITKALTVNAVWKTRTYTVTYMDGRSRLRRVNVNHGKRAKAYTPTKSGLRFEGWYSNRSLTRKANMRKTIRKNTTVYAKFV